MPHFDKSLVWFRRDLRSFDHAALYHALRQSRRVHCAFVFDRDILDGLPRRDRRVEFIHASLQELDAELRRMGGGMIFLRGTAADAIPAVAARLGADAVFTNHDYEPAAIARDAAVARRLGKSAVPLLTFKDQAIFEKDEVLSQAGKPFSVFTPYKNAWLKRLQLRDDGFYLQSYPVERYAAQLAPPPAGEPELPSLADLGFEPSDLADLGIPTGMSGGGQLLEDFVERIGDYADARDYPAVRGTSGLSVHLRFGTVSIRGLAR
ncbi:deoxyribodipyrimidine photo-lyase, partial [Oxalobacteraceae bacterium OM1]